MCSFRVSGASLNAQARHEHLASQGTRLRRLDIEHINCKYLRCRQSTHVSDSYQTEPSIQMCQELQQTIMRVGKDRNTKTVGELTVAKMHIAPMLDKNPVLITYIVRTDSFLLDL